jgi:hypothetical protein
LQLLGKKNGYLDRACVGLALGVAVLCRFLGVLSVNRGFYRSLSNAGGFIHFK